MLQMQSGGSAVLDLKLDNNINPCLDSIGIDLIILYALNLRSLDTLDLIVPCAEAVN